MAEFETPLTTESGEPCDMCDHPAHGDSDCPEQTGYDHLNGFHECGCPGSLRDQLAQAWDEAVEEGHALGWLHDDAYSNLYDRNPYRTRPNRSPAMSTTMDNALTGTPEAYPVHPDDLARGERPTENFYISCAGHCCAAHNWCKYNYKGCPVVTGQVVQDHPCEQCTYEIDDAARHEGSGYARPGEIGHSVTIGLKRETTDGRGQMADMPTDAQVNAAVAEALTGLSINGWALSRVIGSLNDDKESKDDDE